jgi:hypothetical protein
MIKWIEFTKHIRHVPKIVLNIWKLDFFLIQGSF